MSTMDIPASQSIGTTSSVIPPPMYALQDAPGKGKGLFATRDIPRGTRIIAEEPAVRVGTSAESKLQLFNTINSQLAALGPTQYQEFFSLANAFPYADELDRCYGTYRTNALPMGPDLELGGVFFTASRINHACACNAAAYWNEKNKCLTVHALQDIPKGEELTISYVDNQLNRQARQEELLENFRFTCTCALCTLPADQSRANDERLNLIRYIGRVIKQWDREDILLVARRMLNITDEQVRLLSDNSTPDVIGLGNAYTGAFQIVITHGDLARARIFAERVVSSDQICMGNDTPRAEEFTKLAKDPATDHLYGISMQWSTNLDEVPENLDAHEFENWLWRRKSKYGPKPAELADLRDREIFPSFKHLPHQQDSYTDYFRPTGPMGRHPRRHWCFLAEALSTKGSGLVAVRDVNGTNVWLYFRGDNSGSGLSESWVRKRHTVMVLYATCGTNPSFGRGVFVHQPELTKVFPLRLEKLLNLRDMIQKYNDKYDSMRICHGCDVRGADLKRCGNCATFWYCNEDCQRAAWTNRKHKSECRVVSDPDWQAMLHLDWHDYQGCLRFPLQSGNVSAAGTSAE